MARPSPRRPRQPPQSTRALARPSEREHPRAGPSDRRPLARSPARPRVAGLALAAALALPGAGAPVGCARPPPPSLPSSLYGETMPAFRRDALDGREVSSTALRGRIVVVEFFASYCEPCKRSLPAIVELAARDPSLAVVAVGEDERRELTAAMAAEYGLTMPVLHDAGNILAARFRIDGLPSTFVVDERGAIRWVGGADHSAATLARVVAAVRSDRGG